MSAAFSQGAFPDVPIQNARGALEIWSEEVARTVKGVEGLDTAIVTSPEALIPAFRNKSY